MISRDDIVLFLVFYSLLLGILGILDLVSWLRAGEQRQGATPAPPACAVPARPVAGRGGRTRVLRRVKLARLGPSAGPGPPHYDARIATLTIGMPWWHTMRPRARWAVLCYRLAQHTSAQTQRAVLPIAVRFAKMPHLGTQLARVGTISGQDGHWVDSVRPYADHRQR
jgi:hypothetical protein